MDVRALSSAGRAPALQAGGHRFEPYSAHQNNLSEERRESKRGPVVQLVRMPACHAGGRRFEPVPDRQFLKCQNDKLAWLNGRAADL